MLGLVSVWFLVLSVGVCEKGVHFWSEWLYGTVYQSRDGWRQMGEKGTLGSVFDLLIASCLLVLSWRYIWSLDMGELGFTATSLYPGRGGARRRGGRPRTQYQSDVWLCLWNTKSKYSKKASQWEGRTSSIASVSKNVRMSGEGFEGYISVHCKLCVTF